MCACVLLVVIMNPDDGGCFWAASTTNPHNHEIKTSLAGRPPLLPSQNNNHKNPKSRIVACRYLSPSTSNSSPSSRRYHRLSPDSMPSDLTISDSDSVLSSGCTSGARDCTHRPRGVASSAMFWQETNSRLRRLHDPATPLSTMIVQSSKLKHHTSNIGSSSSPTTMSSSSPNKLMAPVLSYARRGKVGENKILDAHLLRLVYNRHLQWRFVNATTGALFLVQKRSVERNLWNAWLTISDLYDTVTRRRLKLQLPRQKLKLASILKGQMNFLEEWGSCVDEYHSISLAEAIEALTATALRLPVFGGATTNIRSLKDAMDSAVNIMQSTALSIRLLLPMVEEVNCLVSEVAKVRSKEQALLEQCRELISLLAPILVEDTSLRTHMLQRNCV